MVSQSNPAVRSSSKPVSAGVLAYRWGKAGVEFLLVHPGGPFWRGKDLAAWSFPKGLVDEAEDLVTAARREFLEEVGRPIEGALVSLPPRRLSSGKLVHAWLAEADIDVGQIESNRFELEWPKGSGLFRNFPEVDRAKYFPAGLALEKIHRDLRPILEDALQQVGQ